MKLVLTSIIAIFLFSCTSETKQESSEQKDSDSKSNFSINTYGAETDTNGAISPSELIKLMESEDSAYVKLSTVILETCSKKGCWMNVAMTNGDEMMVRFKDYGFFVPKAGVVDKSTFFEGSVYYDTLSVEDLRHYALDAGKDSIEIISINEPKPILAFEATGVIIVD